MLKLSILFICLSSCATPMKDRLKKGEISLGPILDLSRSSYLKGCTDNSSRSFQECRKKSKLHEKEIKEILSEE